MTTRKINANQNTNPVILLLMPVFIILIIFR